MSLAPAAQISLPSTAASRPIETADLSLVDPLQRADWDELVARYSGSAFFHSAAWFRTLHAAYGHVPHSLFWKGRVTPAAIVPLMEVKSCLLGSRGICLPFSDFASPLIDPAADLSGLGSALLHYGRGRKWKYFEMRDGGGLFKDAKPSTRFYLHALPLVRPAEDIEGGFDSATRRAIRKAERSGIAVTNDSSLQAVRAFYMLQCITRRKHGLPPQPESFFLALYEHVIARGQGTIFLAHHNGVPIAGAVFVWFGRKALFKYGASDDRMLHLRGNNLVMWRAIKWHLANGFEELHFGRTAMNNQGLRRYKLGFGVEERTHDYFRYQFGTEQFVAVHDAAYSPVIQRLFRSMPPALSRFCGARLYRHVA